jgi:hypothetical protein
MELKRDMLEQNQNNTDNFSMETIDKFNKQKTNTQDHILERTAVVPPEIIQEIISKYKLNEEIAKVVFVLDFEYKIPADLSINYYKYEMERLDQVNFPLPEIYSYLVRYAFEEGFWIKYLTTDFIRRIKHKLSKLLTLEQSLFGNLKGNPEDSALYIIERSYLVNEFINPILNAWMKDHQRSTNKDAAFSFICGINQKAMEKGQVITNELCNRLLANIESIKGILAALDKKAWAQKAIDEFNDVHDKLSDCISNNYDQINLRVVAELVLENCLVMEYEALNHKNLQTIKEKQILIENPSTTEIVSETKEDIVKDKATLVLLTIDNLEEEKQKEFIHDLVFEKYNEAMKSYHQKPMQFAKDFLNRLLLEEFSFSSSLVQKIIKKFDNQLIYRLSPVGSAKFPNLTIDEKVMQLLEDTIFDYLKQKNSLQDEAAEKELLETPTKKIEATNINATTISNETKQLEIRELSDKDLGLLVRDEYLKELFNNNEEILAGAKVLKRYSLDLGLLLTENEAITLITEELEKRNIILKESNSEELDKTICIVIINQLKEQKQYQTKIT